MHKNLTVEERAEMLKIVRAKATKNAEQLNTNNKVFYEKISVATSSLQHNNAVLDNDLKKLEETRLVGKHSDTGKCEIS